MKRIIWCTPGNPREASWITEVTRLGFTVVRRCVEAVDVLAAASVESQAAVVLDIDTPRLSADVIAAIPGINERIVVGLVTDDDAAERARLWGIETTIRQLDADAVDRLVAELGASKEPVSASAQVTSSAVTPRPDAGGITVVYGPTGAPGRSTVALGLAESWARAGDRVCLVDADTFGPSLALLVGMTEDVSGVLVASRYADQGALDARSLGSACRRLDDRLWLMSGVGSPERWHQLRPAALERVLRTCAEHFDRVVVDTHPLVSVGELDDVVPGGVPRRDSATRSALQLSDSVLAVTQPDAVSVVRLTVELPAIFSVLAHSKVSVAVNRVSRGDARATSRVREVLTETGINAPLHAIPEDKSVLTCRRNGSLLSEVSATKKLRRSLSRLGESIAA